MPFYFIAQGLSQLYQTDLLIFCQTINRELQYSCFQRRWLEHNFLALFYGKPNGHAQKAVMVQRGQIVGTRNTSVCSENVSSVFSYWLFNIQSYKISQGSYAWVHNDICIVKERKMCT